METTDLAGLICILIGAAAFIGMWIVLLLAALGANYFNSLK